MSYVILLCLLGVWSLEQKTLTERDIKRHRQGMWESLIHQVHFIRHLNVLGKKRIYLMVINVADVRAVYFSDENTK